MKRAPLRERAPSDKSAEKSSDKTVVAAKSPAVSKPVAAVKTTPNPLLAVISVGSQRLAVYDSTGAIVHAPVSTGQAGHRTPFGVFSVIQKDRFHASNIYSGAPMPYMQRITWSGIAMHAGALPGYPASHGCIRMPDGTANKLFGMTRMGMRVIVSPHDVTPSAFSHAALPVPLMTPAPAGNEQAAIRQGAVETISTSGQRMAQVDGPARDIAPVGSADSSARLLNPQQRAQFNRTKARADAIAAVKRSKEALEESQRASAEANTAALDLKAAQVSYDASLGFLASAKSLLQVASTPEMRARALEAVSDAETRVADMTRHLTEARAAEAVWTPEAFSTAVASREADEAVDTSEKAAKAAEHAVEPVSVFISRKEGKLFVRQAFVPIFEAPVTFRGQEPLGTHLYVAMDADQSAGRLKWMSVSVPNSSGGSVDRTPVKRGQAPAEPVGRSSNAAEALERVTIPADVMEKLAEKMWLGGSVIVSDLGISGETGVGTDFVVLTK